VVLDAPIESFDMPETGIYSLLKRSIEVEDVNIILNCESKILPNTTHTCKNPTYNNKNHTIS